MTSKTAATSIHRDDITDGRIVSSRHLVSERCAELSELEYALLMCLSFFCPAGVWGMFIRFQNGASSSIGG